MNVFKLCLLILNVFLLSSCGDNSGIESGYQSSSGGGSKTPIYVGIKVEVEKASIDDDVLISIAYGHSSQDTLDLNEFDGHLLELVLYDDFTKEFLTIYSKEFDGHDFYDEENRCFVDGNLGGNIEYQQIVQYSIRFSDYDFDSGRIYVKLTETYLSPNSVDGEIVIEVVENIERRSINFSIDEGEVTFSER